MSSYPTAFRSAALYAHEPTDEWPNPWKRPALWLVWPEEAHDFEGEGRSLQYLGVQAWKPGPDLGIPSIVRGARMPARRPQYRAAAWLWVPSADPYGSDDLWHCSGGGGSLEQATAWAMREARKLEADRDDYARRLENLEPEALELVA